MNFVTRKKLDRRLFLKGAAYSVALPMLDAMRPAMGSLADAAISADQKNFLYFYFPFGTMPLGDAGQGERDTPHLSFSLTQNLSPLQDLYDRKKWHLMRGIHHAGTAHGAASTLTANAADNGRSSVKNESFDNYLARELSGAATRRFPNLVLGVRDRGSRGELMRHFISWRGPGAFNNKQMSAVNLYNGLFANMGDNNLDGQARHEIIQKKGAVDSVLADAQGLRATLGAEDKLRLDSYLDSIRSVERRLQDSLDNTPASRVIVYPKPTDFEPTTLVNFEEKSHTMIDLAMIAFASGQSQVASLMLDNCGQGVGFLTDYNISYHDAGSRAGSLHAWPDRFSRDFLYRFHRMLARVYKNGIERMEEHAIYDQTSFIMSSESGFHHVGSNTDFLVAGGMFANAGGTTVGYNKEAGHLYTTMAQKMGLNLGGFGKSSGTMTW